MIDFGSFKYLNCFHHYLFNSYSLPTKVTIINRTLSQEKCQPASHNSTVLRGAITVNMNFKTDKRKNNTQLKSNLSVLA